ncbi:response regulator [Pedobacter sp. MR2016-24]|uniref:response regulator n=1 Tax=Pedobacter sp. MR2016-24 TaxID=2994466 RepID=UPI00224872D2|nr:response regulator [Pedobacter sp. MR2016-24]MCX2484885.1 response regulator [Pedobacter sp. MR2016-24]
MKSTFQLLVIDDDAINIFIIKKLIEKTGYLLEIISMSNGELAIEHLKKQNSQNLALPDLIFLDINMPIMTGWEFLVEYEKLGIEKMIPVYMLSSSIFQNDIDKARTFPNVKDFMSKPMSNHQLINIFDSMGLTLPEVTE